MKRDEIIKIGFEFISLKRLEKNSGSVIELLAMTEYRLRRFATRSQFRYVPIKSPIAVQAASAAPHQNATPGRPMSSQPLMSEASALIAATQGPRPRPPRKKSSLLSFARRAVTRPTMTTASRYSDIEIIISTDVLSIIPSPNFVFCIYMK